MNIYLQNETNFSHNGLGFLIDVLNAKVEDNLNGDYSLIFEYKKEGKLSEYLVNENIVRCRVADGSNQLFIIKNVIKTFNSIQVICKHIFYRLLDNFVEDVAPANLSGQPFLQWILNKTNYDNKFTAHSDISTPKSARYVRRNPVDCILGDTDNSMINLFGGELKRNNFDIYFNKKIGSNNGVKLIIGKNITGINITIDTNSVHTKIMPQGYDGLFLPEKYVNSPLINSYVSPKIYKVEFSDIKYDPEDEYAYHTQDEAYEALRNAVQGLFNNGIDKPTINVKVDWIELSKTNEYKNYVNLERVNLGDTITIDLLGVQYQSRVIKTIYNVLNDKIETFEIGKPKANLSDSTNQIIKQIEKVNPTSILEQAKKNATEQLTKAMGGYVYKTENELFIMDTNDVVTATKVWRWNLNGLGYSKNGINGPYETAITQDGQIVADFITTGKLNTSVIEGYDSLITMVKNIPAITTENEGTGTLLLQNLMNSRLIYLNIHPTSKDILGLFASTQLKASPNLKSLSRKIWFEGNTNFSYLLPNNLYFYSETIYDEFIFDGAEKQIYIIHRVGIDNEGNKYELEEEIKESFEYYDYFIGDGDYKIYMPSYPSAYISIKAMIKNDYTTQFATKLELSNSITQTSNSIMQEVNLDLDTLKENVNASLELKVDTDKLMSQINAKADEINFESNKMRIKTDDFEIANGNATFSGKIVGAEISSNTLNGNNIIGGNITGATIDGNMISGGTINGTTISGNTISGNTISGGTINGTTITGVNIITNTDSFQNGIEVQSNNAGTKFQIRGTTAVAINSNNESTIQMMYESGWIRCVNLIQTSLESQKRDFEKFKNALKIIKDIDIYKYHLKGEKADAKKHIGFVIGKKYKYSSEITSTDEDGNEIGVDVYSMTSLCLQAIKEQQEIINKLIKRIEVLENAKNVIKNDI